ncbi:Inactive receptor-like serine/threonine-protein kinase-like protein, partial [Drosera capensis]
RNNGQSGDFSQRRLLNDALASKTQENVVPKVKNSTKSSTSPAGSHIASHTAHSPSQSPSKSPVAHRSQVPAPAPSQLRHHHTARKHLKAPSPSPQAKPAGISSHPASNHSAPGPSPPSTSGGSLINITSEKNKHLALVWSLVAIGGVLVIASVIGIIICQNSRAVAVKPWATGISGKLQKAFVSGVPNLKRLELEAACEEFSNIIGSLSDGTVYKGTLSSGVEIAVVSTFVKSSQLWTPDLQAQFRKKIATLSKVNHKNFVNLIGHCEEDQPFSRMMVFEYAPNGSLFEHLHIQEAERLDWGMRLRIIMGMAYCLEYMHQLRPPIAHRDLHSSSIYLTEDYAAKISDFSFWSSQVTTRRMVIRSPSMELLDTQMVDLETNVYNFGVILFEMITGEILDSGADGCLAEWMKEYLRGDELPDEAIDPTLTVSPEDKVIVQGLFTILKDCLHSDPRERPTMREVTTGLRKITRIEPSGATPGLSPLWWAELDILSTDGTTEV